MRKSKLKIIAKGNLGNCKLSSANYRDHAFFFFYPTYVIPTLRYHFFGAAFYIQWTYLLTI